jgi:hypothetical protein
MTSHPPLEPDEVAVTLKTCSRLLAPKSTPHYLGAALRLEECLNAVTPFAQDVAAGEGGAIDQDAFKAFTVQLMIANAELLTALTHDGVVVAPDKMTWCAQVLRQYGIESSVKPDC